MAEALPHARARQDAAAAASLPLVAGGLAVLHGAWAVLALAAPATAGGVLASAGHGGVSLALGLMALLAHAGRIPARSAQPAAAAAVLLAALTSAGLLALTGNRFPAVGVVLAVVWGALGLEARALAGVAAAVWTGWIAVALSVGVDAGLAGFSAALASATGLAAAVSLERRRSREDRHAAWQQVEVGRVRDELTGLLNERGLLLAARPILEAARRRGDAVHCILVDIDGMAGVNQRLGPAAGDDVVLAVAEALRACVRGTDVVARGRDDEFWVLGPGPGMPPVELERRVRARLSAAPPVDRRVWDPRLTSGGAVLAPWDAGGLDTLLALADGDIAVHRSARRHPFGRRLPPETAPAAD